MRTAGALATAGAVLAAGLLAAGAGVTVAAVTKSPAGTGKAPAARAGRRAGTGSEGGASVAALVGPAGLRVKKGICTAPGAEAALATRLSSDIQHALRGRSGHPAVTVNDSGSGVSCQLNATAHFDSASIVKAVILAALLRWHQENGTALSGWERDEATLMITQSDNDAATALWNEVGMSRLQHLLDLTGMTETELGRGGLWGLTRVTARDEMLLLQHLAQPNSVLSAASRSYQLGLMAEVISSQRWGTPYGAPRGVTVHVKNGWLHDGTGWHVNSLGVFTRAKPARNYQIAVLTTGSPSEQYAINTIQGVARVVHRDLNAATPPSGARLAANVAPTAHPGGASWAVVPALPAPRQPQR